MNKKELAEQVKASTQLTISQANEAIGAVTEVIIDALTEGDNVTLAGFGTFGIRNEKQE